MIQGETVCLPVLSLIISCMSAVLCRAVGKNCRAFQPQLSARAVCFDSFVASHFTDFSFQNAVECFEVQNLTAQWCTVINESQKPYWKDTAHRWISKFPTRLWIIFQSSVVYQLHLVPVLRCLWYFSSLVVSRKDLISRIEKVLLVKKVPSLQF